MKTGISYMKRYGREKKQQVQMPLSESIRSEQRGQWGWIGEVNNKGRHVINLESRITGLRRVVLNGLVNH